MSVALIGVFIGVVLFNPQVHSWQHFIILWIVGLSYIFEKRIIDKKKVDSIQLRAWLKVLVYLICSISVSTLFVDYFSTDISELLPNYFGLILFSMGFGMLVYYETKKEIENLKNQASDNN